MKRVYLRTASTPARGFTIIELMISVSIIGVLLAGVVVFLTDTTRTTQDRVLRARTRDDAARLLEMICHEIRIAGSGMPLSQTNFAATDSLIGDAALPILTSADGSRITFRTSPNGVTFILNSDYAPSDVNRTINLLSSEGLTRGDEIYLSNITRGGDDGMRAIISSVSGNAVAIEQGFTALAGAIFETGSVLHKVATITYHSNGADSGIVRTEGSVSSIFAERAAVAFRYVDGAGEELPLPLTPDIIANSLAAVAVTINVQSDRRLRNRSYYTAETQQSAALRAVLLER